MLRFASAITEQKKCWELLPEKFDRFQTLRNNTQQQPTTCNRVCKLTQRVTSNIVGSCWPTMLRPFAQGLRADRLSQAGPVCWVGSSAEVTFIRVLHEKGHPGAAIFSGVYTLGVNLDRELNAIQAILAVRYIGKWRKFG